MRKLGKKLSSYMLIFAMVVTSLSVPQNVTDVTAQETNETVSVVRNISDLIQVTVDDEKVETLKLYQNGLYETGVKLAAGTHTIALKVNKTSEGDTKTVDINEDKTVWFRYQDGTFYDSVDDAAAFHTAAIVGNFDGLTFVDENAEEYAIDNWAPAEEDASLTYMGGGIFEKTFMFQELEKDVTLSDGGYKVAFDGGWDYSIGDGSNNIALTIPSGTSELTVFVDEVNGNVYDSVRSQAYQVTQNVETVTYPAFDMSVSLIGTVRGDDSINWSAEQKGYEFTQLTDNMYINQMTLDAGSYDYKAVFNYESWYEKTSGNKNISITGDSKNVVFLYDASTEMLYDSVNDSSTIAVTLGMEEEKAVSSVVTNANGTTTFITTAASSEEDKVELVYAKKETPNVTTTVELSKGTDSNDDFNGSFQSNEIFFGDGAVDVIYYYEVNGTKYLDSSSDPITVGEESYSNYQREEYTGRVVNVPGTFPGPSWDATSNQMDYLGDGLYSYTFKDVPAANYEFKIAMGSWSENYGVDGINGGSNYSVTLTETKDVTVYYSDLTTHLAVTSLNYEFADISLEGTGIEEGVKLEDAGLTGIYSTTLDLGKGTYSNLQMVYGDNVYAVDSFTLPEEKAVTFYFDPSTEIYYNNSTESEVDADTVYFDSKDSTYKSVYGAVSENEDVTFSIQTGSDVTKAKLIIKGKENSQITLTSKENEAGKLWSGTTSFTEYGEYTYFFVLYYGSFIKVYCDDDGYYGTGVLTDLTNLKAYDLVVYKDGYTTPDWMKNAVVYQIFPDRFMNGDTSNDQAQTQARGETDYEYVTDWYSWPENPDQETLNADTYPEQAAEGDGIWNNEIYGGDLEGIVERMDYLKALGVNVIYLNPIFSSISSHRYDTSDYTEIDPILGDMGDFSELVEAAEKNNLHIVLDGVFNHVSDDSIYFDRYYKFIGQDGKVGAYPYWAYVYDYMSENEYVSQSEAEAAAKTYFEGRGVTDFSYTEWFNITNTILTDDNGNAVQDTIGERAGKDVYGYDGWWGYDSMPVILSTNGSEYQTGDWADEIIDGTDSVTKYWLSQGSNGWRLDVANEVSDETWQHFRESVKSLSSDNVIIGEIWDDATEYILGDMYDSVMNYVFRDAVLAFAKGGSSQDAVKTLEKIRERYPEEAFYAMMNLVGSHDTTRLLSYLDGIQDDRAQTDVESAYPSYETTSDEAKARQYLVALIQMTYPGAPTIYYGDELGMVGADDPDNRRAMTWGEGNQELVEWYATLAGIRKNYSALRTGDISPFEVKNENGSVNDSLMSYVRSDEDAELIVVTNNSSEAETITLAVNDYITMTGSTLTELVTGDARTVQDGKVTVSVPAYRGVILTEQVKKTSVDYEALKPAYDSSYIVTKEQSDSDSAQKEKTVQVITVASESYSKKVGDKAFSLKAATNGDGVLKFETSNKSVVTVSSTGKVTIKGKGEAKITITASETDTYQSATKVVNVKVTEKTLPSKQTLQKLYNNMIAWLNKHFSLKKLLQKKK